MKRHAGGSASDGDLTKEPYDDDFPTPRLGERRPDVEAKRAQQRQTHERELTLRRTLLALTVSAGIVAVLLVAGLASGNVTIEAFQVAVTGVYAPIIGILGVVVGLRFKVT